ncbi:MAG TPA: lanthionine synthetase LanC family protein [Kofleriaceae bacterium]|nr:lanthionine synthetase LanC family protein [Kofleriaceae bacterium]
MGASPCFGYGRGGIAYTLLKAGILRGDRSLVESAQRWAAAGLRSGHRFRMRRWPKGSFSRGLTGLHAIHALAAHAAGHDTTCRRELQRFVASARRGRGSIELFRGMAGRLAGTAIVMRSVAEPAVRTLGDEMADRIMEQLAARDRGAARGARLSPRGVAHGWPGVVLGALSWQAVARSLPEAALRRAVITAQREVSASIDRGRIDWAHGHAGMALLFARAYLQLGDRRFLAWARQAAAQACARPCGGVSLPDGAPGVAYCLLAVAAADPGGPWRDAAWAIAGRVLSYVDVPDRDPYGVWSGLGGVCCLLLDLLHETAAGFPGIEA